MLWQGHNDSNAEPTDLESATLPIELYPYVTVVNRKYYTVHGLKCQSLFKIFFGADGEVVL